jgi:hypothetical protein
MTISADIAREVLADAKAEKAELIRRIARDQSALHEVDQTIVKAQRIIARSQPTIERREYVLRC